MKFGFVGMFLATVLVASSSLAEVPQGDHEPRASEENKPRYVLETAPMPQENGVPEEITGTWSTKKVYALPRRMQFDEGFVEVSSQVVTIKIDKEGRLCHQLRYFRDANGTDPVRTGRYSESGTIKFTPTNSENEYSFVYTKGRFFAGGPALDNATLTISKNSEILTFNSGKRKGESFSKLAE